MGPQLFFPLLSACQGVGVNATAPTSKVSPFFPPHPTLGSQLLCHLPSHRNCGQASPEPPGPPGQQAGRRG